MRKAMRNVLSVLLVFCMVFGMLPASAFRAYAEEAWSFPEHISYDSGTGYHTIKVLGVTYLTDEWYEKDAGGNLFKLPGTDLHIIYFGYKKAGTVSRTYAFYILPNPDVNLETGLNGEGNPANLTVPSFYNQLTINNGTQDWDLHKESINVLYLGDGVQAISNEAFIGKTSLAEVYLAHSVKTIGDSAFTSKKITESNIISACTKLSVIDLSYVETIGKNAFSGCTSLTSVTIATGTGAHLKEIKAQAFYGTNITDVVIGSGTPEQQGIMYEEIFYHGKAAYNVQRVTIGNYVTVGTRDFRDQQRLTYLNIGEHTKVGKDAFCYCYYLQESTNGETAGKGTAKGCLDLHGVTLVDDSAFYSCSRVKNIDLSSAVSIGSSAFSYCDSANFKKLTLGSGLTSMGNWAFQGCGKLQTVNFDVLNKLTTIPYGCFARTGLVSVEIPSCVETISSFAFSATRDGSYVDEGPRKYLTSLSFAEGSKLKKIDSYAFYEQNLQNGVTFPASLLTVGAQAFYHEWGIGSVVFNSKDSITINTAAFNIAGVTDLTIAAQNYTNIQASAFSGNPINTIDIQTKQSVTIGRSGFSHHKGSGFTSLTIDASDINIGESAFETPEMYKDKEAYPNYHSLETVTLNGTKISIGKSAFRYNNNLSVLNLHNITDASQLTLGTYAFGHDVTDTYYSEKSALEVYNDNGELEALSSTAGLLINLGGKDKTPRDVGFKSGLTEEHPNYYPGDGYQAVLESVTYPTCQEAGVSTYRLYMIDGTRTPYTYRIETSPLGHLYDEGEYHDPDCVHSAYKLYTCVRGQVDPAYGVDLEGYAIDNNKQRITDACQESGCTKIVEYEDLAGGEPLSHEYYAGKLYSRALSFDMSDIKQAAAYNSLSATEKTNYFPRYYNTSGTSIYLPEYDALSAAEKEDYTVHYEGTEFITKGDYEDLNAAKKMLYTEVTGESLGRILPGSKVGSNWQVKVDDELTYTSPFTDYNLVYIEYHCYRNAHCVKEEPEIYPISIAYIPTDLKGTTEMTLRDVPIGLNNLSWKDENQSLAGAAGDRKFIALYTPDGKVGDFYRPVEIELTVAVTRVDKSLEDISFSNTVQSTASTNVDVDVKNLPSGMTVSAIQYYKDAAGTESITLEKINEVKVEMNGCVDVTIAYDNDIYNLIASEGFYWRDGVYNTDPAKTKEKVTAIPDDYTIQSISLGVDGTVSVRIRHDFKLSPPDLGLIEVTGDIGVYDETKTYGFTLSNVPAASTIQAIRWTAASETGTKYTGTGAYDNTIQLSAPGAGLNTETDLREVADFSGIVQNVGTYHYKVIVTNSEYTGDYTAYVTVKVTKKATAVPSPTNAVYDGTLKTGFTAKDGLYSVTGNTATNAGTYEATFSLTNLNYKWDGYADEVTTAKANWIIEKCTVAVPTVKSGMRFLEYNGEMQTPLDFTNIDTVQNDTPVNGDYKYEVDGNLSDGRYLVSSFINGKWQAVYNLYDANRRNAGTYNILSSKNKTSGLFDTSNFQWPGGANTLDLGEWVITKSAITLPTFFAQTVEYTGQPYEGRLSLGGSWNTTYSAIYGGGAANSIYDKETPLTYTYYTKWTGNPATSTPTNTTSSGVSAEGSAPVYVGDYIVVTDVEPAICDDQYTYTSGKTYVYANFSITKKRVKVLDSAEIADGLKKVYYSGQDQTLPAVSFEDSDGNPFQLPSDVVLHYYEAKAMKVDGEGEQYIYLPQDLSSYNTTGKVSAHVGTYSYVVGIDPNEKNYASDNYGRTGLIVEKVAASAIKVEKKDITTTPVLRKIEAGYSLSAEMGTAAEVLHVYSTDSLATLTFVIDGQEYANVAAAETADQKIAYSISSTFDNDHNYTGADVTIAFKEVGSALPITINSKETDNAGPGTETLLVTVGKAKADVTVTVQPPSASFGSTFNVTTSVQGVAPRKLDGSSYTTVSTISSSCDVYYIKKSEYNEALSLEAQTSKSAIQPTGVGDYYVIAKYDATANSDPNYVDSYSAPASMTITKASMIVESSSTGGGAYKGSSYPIVTGCTVTDSTTSKTPLVEGNDYSFEYYAFKNVQESVAKADSANWSAVEPTVKDVADSGDYWFRVVSPNFDTVYRKVTMTVTRVNVTVSADSTLAKTKVYDNTKTAFSKNGESVWYLTDSAITFSSTVTPEEVEKVAVKAEYDVARSGKESDISVTYTLTGTNIKPNNYTINGQTLAEDSSYKDTTTFAKKGEITQKGLTITGVAAENREYNGTSAVTLTGSALKTTGIVAGDGSAVSAVLVSGKKGTISGTQFGASDTPYSVAIDPDAVVISGTGSGNYYVEKVGASITESILTQPAVTISKRILEIGFSDQSIEFTSAPAVGYNTANLTLLKERSDDASSVASDVVSLKTNLVYTFSTDAAGQNVIDTPVAQGEYYLKASLPASDNYTATAVIKKLTIAPASLTANAVPYAGKAYDGASHDPATFTVTGVGGSTLSGYTIWYIKAGEGETQKPDKDDERWTTATKVTDVPDSGKYFYKVTMDNYSPAIDSVDVEIQPINLGIAKDGLVTTRQYDATTGAAISSTAAVTAAKTIGSESITAAATASYNAASVSAADQITIIYNMTFAGGAKAENYTYTTATTTGPAVFVNGTAVEVVGGTITQRELTIDGGLTATNRSYDMTTVTAITGTPSAIDLVATAAIAGKTLTLSLVSGAEGAMADANAGQNKTVTIAPDQIRLTGSDAHNFTITGVNDVKVDIEKAYPIIDGPSENKVGYSGQPVKPAYYYVTVKDIDDTTVLAKDDSSKITYSFYQDSDRSVPAVSGKTAAEAPTNRRQVSGEDAPYYLLAVYEGDDNHYSKQLEYELTIGGTSFDRDTTDVFPYTGVYDGLAHDIISGAAIKSTIGTSGSGKNGDITEETSIYVMAKTGTTKPAETADGWTLTFVNGKSVTTGAIKVTDAGTYEYWYKLVHPSHETIIGTDPLKVVITEATLTLSSDLGTKTKVYDATTGAAVTASVEGMQNSESISVAASAAYGSKGQGTGKSITVIYTLTFSGGSKASNYKVVDKTQDISKVAGETNAYKYSVNDGAITKKDIDVTNVSAIGRNYDTTTLVTLSGTPTSSGICAGDDVTLELSTGANGSIASAKPAENVDVTVDTNKIVLGGADSGNYAVKTVNTPKVTIGKVQLELTFGGKTSSSGSGEQGSLSDVSYTGNALAATAYQSAVVINPVTNGITPAAVVYSFWSDAQCTTSAVIGANGATAPTAAGTYYIKASVAGDDYYKGASLVSRIVVSDASLTVSVTPYSGTYDASAHDLWTAISVTGIVGGTADQAITNYDVKFIKAAAEEDAAPSASDQRWNSAVTKVTNVTDSGIYWYKVSAANFTTVTGRVGAPSGKVVISPAELTFSRTMASDATKVYDAGTAAEISANTTSVAGIQSAETYVLTATAAYEDKNAGTNKDIITTYVLTFSGSADPDNYVYNGSGITKSVNGEKKTVWTVKETADNVGTITQKPVTITSTSAIGKTYDASSEVSLVLGGTDDFISGDTVSLALTDGKANASDANAGSAKTVTVETGDYKLEGSDAPNYSISNIGSTTTVDIYKKDWTVSWSDKTADYNGLAVPSTLYSASFTGVSTDQPAAADVTYFFKKSTQQDAAYTTQAPISAGSYTMKLEIEAETNYNAFTTTRALSINDAGLTVVVDPYTGIYDGGSHSVASAVSVKGIVNGTAGTDITGYKVSYIKAASDTEAKPAAADTRWSTNGAILVKDVADSGKYWYKVEADNFTTKIDALSGKVTISQRELTFTVSGLPLTKVYDGTTDVVTTAQAVAVDGIVTGEAITANVTTAVYNDADVADADTITETISVVFGDGVTAGNYKYGGSGNCTGAGPWTVTQTETASITTRALTLEIINQVSFYNNEEPWTDRKQTSSADTFWVVTNGAIQTGDTKDSLHVVLTKAAGIELGTYNITGTYTNTNYAVSFVGEGSSNTCAAYTIEARPIAVTIADTNGTYGNDPSVKLVKGLLTDTGGNTYGVNHTINTIQDMVGEGSGQIHLRTDALNTSDVITSGYAIYVADDLGAKVTKGIYGGYEITFTDGVYTVAQRNVTFTADALSSFYDDTLKELTYTTGAGTTLVNGDQIEIVLTTTAIHTDTQTSDVGPYDITFSSVRVLNGKADKTGNYNITSNAGIYTINPAEFNFYFTNTDTSQFIEFGKDYENPIIFRNSVSGRTMNAENGNAFDGTLVYATGNQEVATIDQNGTVHPLKTGSTTVTATVSAATNYKITDTVKSYTVNVGLAGSIRINVAALGGYEKIHDVNDRETFDEQELVNATVTYPEDASLVTVTYELSTDGAVSWTSPSAIVPSAAAPGIYYVRVKGTANDYGDFEQEIAVEIKELDLMSMTYETNGGSITTASAVQTNVVRIKKGFALKDSDFPSVESAGRTFKGWKLAGSDTRFADGWNGTIIAESMTFIAQWEANPSGGLTIDTIPDQTYTGSKIEPSIVVRCEGVIADESEYIVKVINNINVKDADDADAPTVKVYGINTLKDLGAQATFSIVPKSLGEGTVYNTGITVGNIAAQAYTGQKIEPEIRLNDGSMLLELGKDYTVEYSHNIESGEAITSIAGIHNYCGEITASFSIVYAGDVQGFTVFSDTDNLIYTGQEIKPVTAVYGLGRLLVEGEDYTLTYKDNINVTTGAAMTVTGLGVFTSTAAVTVDFEIHPKDIATCLAALDEISFEYDATAKKPAVTVTDGAIILVKGDDYLVSYKNNVNVGDATAVISGKGNYNGSQSLPFVITPTGGAVTRKDGDLIVEVSTEGAISVYGPDFINIGSNRLLTEITEYNLTITTPYSDEPLPISILNVVGVYIITADGAEGSDYWGMTGDAVYVNSAGVKDTSGVYDIVYDDDDITETKNDVNISNNVKVIYFDGGDMVDLLVSYLEINDELCVYGNKMGSQYISVEVAPGPYYYVDGQLQGVEPEISVYAGKTSLRTGKKLNEVDDYTVMFGNNNGPGMGTYEITGKGRYTGTVTGEFEILASSPAITSAPAFSSMAPVQVPEETTSGSAVNQNEVVEENKQAAEEKKQETEETQQNAEENKQETEETTQNAEEIKQNAEETTSCSAVNQNEVVGENKQAAEEKKQETEETTQNAEEIKQNAEETTSCSAVNESKAAEENQQPAEENKQETEEPKQEESEKTNNFASGTAIRVPKNIQLTRLVASLGAHTPGVTPYIIKIEKNYDGEYHEVTAMDSIGTYRITFDMAGEEVELILAVAAKDITKANITLSGTAFTYGGYAHTPAVKVVDKYQCLEDGVLVEKTKTLVKGVDYTVSYEGNVEIGTAYAKIKGIGNYRNTATQSFLITDKQPNDPPGGNGGGSGGGGGGSAPTEYKITLVTEGNSGTLVSSAQTAPANDTVIVVAVTAKGYAVKTFTVTDAKGNEVKTSKVDDNSYSFVMPAMDVTVKASFASVFVLNYAECYLKDDCALSDFPDVDIHKWYHDGAHFCVENGITYGYANGYFGPEDTLTRGMYITMLYNMAGRPASNKISEFGDVDKSLWYSIPIKWAEDHGVIAGYTRGAVFGPNDAISREQMAQIMYNYAKYCGKDVVQYENTDISMFPDAYKLSPWAVTAMKWAVGSGVISGRTDGTLGVLDSTTRAEATTVFLKYVLATETTYDHLIFIDVHREAQ